MSKRSSWLIIFFKPSIFSLTFCLFFPLQRMGIKTLLLLNNLYLCSVSSLFLHVLWALVLGVYTSIIVISCWYADPLVIMKLLSLFQVIFLISKRFLSETKIASYSHYNTTQKKEFKENILPKCFVYRKHFFLILLWCFLYEVVTKYLVYWFRNLKKRTVQSRLIILWYMVAIVIYVNN